MLHLSNTAIVSYFSITFIFIKHFCKSFFHKCNNPLHLGIIFIFFLLIVTFFFFSKLIEFEALSLRKLQNLFVRSFPRFKLCLFYILSKAHVVYIEYPQRVCSPIFVVEDFSRLFAHHLFFNEKLEVSINNVWHGI